jgi:hypothetical protein
MMGRLAGNLRGDVDVAPPGAAPTPFAAPAVQAPADVARSLAHAGMPQAFSLPAALEPLRDAPGAGSAGAHGLEPFGTGDAGLGSGRALSSGRLLDESSSVPQLVGLPEPLAPQPEAELLTTANPHANPQSYPNPSSVSSNTRAGGGGGSACESGGGAHSSFFGDRVAAAREAQRLFLLAQQQYAQARTRACRQQRQACSLRRSAVCEMKAVWARGRWKDTGGSSPEVITHVCLWYACEGMQTPAPVLHV